MKNRNATGLPGMLLLFMLPAGCEDDGKDPTTPEERMTTTDYRPPKNADAVAASEPAAGKDWASWRGPDGTGVSSEADWQAEWPEDGPEIAWKQDVGTGYSQVAVVGQRVYTLGHVDGEEFVYCFHADTGDLIWKHGYKGQLVNYLHSGGPASTPCVRDGRLYTLGREGQFFCWDALDGKVLWKKDLQSELDVELPDWGFSASPVVAGDNIVLEAGRVVAFDLRTGDIRWKTDKHDAGYGSVRPFSQNGRTLLAVLTNDALDVLKAEDGEPVASYTWETHFNTNGTTPVVSDDLIFISSGYRRGCALVKLADGELEEVYTNKDMSNHMSTSVLMGDYVYGIDGNSSSSRSVELVCMDFKSGAVQWEQRGLGCGSLTAAAGKLIVLGDKGDLAIVEATPEAYREISRAKVIEATCWTAPILSHGRIYCRNDGGRVVCVNVRR